MLKTIFSFSILFCLWACSAKQTVKEAQQQATKIDTIPAVAVPIVGADSDAHGCKGSAGYTWSVVKNECIQIFNAGTRLDPKAAHLDKTLSAFVVFKSTTEDAQAEIFMPNEQKSLILKKDTKNEAGKWTNETYVLAQWKGVYTLEDSHKKVLYQGASVKY